MDLDCLPAGFTSSRKQRLLDLVRALWRVLILEYHTNLLPLLKVYQEASDHETLELVMELQLTRTTLERIENSFARKEAKVDRLLATMAITTLLLPLKNS